MIRASLLCVVLYAITAVQSDATDIVTVKHGIIKREALLAAEAIRKIVLKTPQDRVEITTMASDFASALYYSLYSLDNVVQNIGGDAQKEVGLVISLLSRYVNDIHQAIPGDAQLLKDKLAAILEELHKSLVERENDPKVTDYTEFGALHHEREHDFTIYGLYKLKLQALLFGKSNIELEAEIKTSLAKVTEVLSPKADDARILKVLRRALLQVSIITERCTNKMENWLAANRNSSFHDTWIVQDVTSTLSDLYDKESRALRKDRTLYRMKSDLLDICVTGKKAAIKLLTVKYPDNTGGQELIRSCIFDTIAFGTAYAENFKSVLV